nr:plancitoxin-1 [Parasteatoda tepidariorum]
MENLFLFLLLVSCSVHFSFALRCKDDRGRNVDWFILYKLPKISSEPAGTPLEDGEAYAYITSQDENNWTLSPHKITSHKSMLGRTWQGLKNKEQTATYLFYNDDSPENFKGSAVGHLKGFLAFDNRNGYWLSHSIPRFGRMHSYEYPETAVTNGQHAICITFNVAALKKISKHLLYAHPNIYLRSLSDVVSLKLDQESRSLFTDKPAFIRSGDLTNVEGLNSIGGQSFLSFAKDNQFSGDLYSDIIAPGIKSSLYAETWRRGAGTNLKPACQTDYKIIDIVAINMTANDRGKNKNIYFKSTEDHSKWAVSIERGNNWVCMADMNRMASQQRRGGGALCFKSSYASNAFKNIIAETDQCPI